MAPADRRAALIEACVPLIKEYGANVTTRQIADAAGVAEGTIFGVFPDKAALIRATVVRAMDPQDTIDAIGAIDRSLDIRLKLEAATAILVDRTAENVALLTPLFRSGVLHPPGSERGDTHGPPPEIRESRERIIDAVVALIGPDAHRLRRSPATTVGLLIAMVFVGGHGGFGFTTPVTSPEEIVSLLLDGLLRPASATVTGGTTC